MNFLNIPGQLLTNLNVAWTFILLFARFGSMFLIIPGVGGGERGIFVRSAAVIVISLVCVAGSPVAELPADWVMLIAQIVSEVLLGFSLSLVPIMTISALQTAGVLSGTTMGLGMGNLLDPSLGMPVPDMARIFGDLAVLMFLLIGGHHILIYAASGFSSQIVPGTFVIGEGAIEVLAQRSGEIFSVGVMVAAPVIVALLLTQFMMGLVSRAVPTVNIFIVSFPLTIGIVLIITILALPELVEIVRVQYTSLESSVFALLKDSISN